MAQPTDVQDLGENSQLDSLVGQAVGEYFQCLENGEQPQLGEFVERYPEIRELLKTVIPALQAAEGVSDVTATDVDPREHKQLGDFRILRQIGRGGMGIVYEAEQISMHRRVALKVLPLAGLVDDMKIRRFQNEVRAVAALDHPNIVAVYMIGEERGVHYYAMRLIRGRSLSEVISSLKQVHDADEELDGATISQVTEMRPSDNVASDESEATTKPDSRQPGWDTSQPSAETVAQADSSTIPHSSRREYFRSVVALGIQAASALQHAHEQGVIHRDIKPGNLLLDSCAKLYVTDFGLARIEADAGVTMTGDLIGTLRYMAPEQALAKRVTVDHRADIYSLAATLYELLTLQPTYSAPDRQQLLKQIAFEEPIALRRLDREIPTELETIIHKALSKDMDQRYTSAGELADDLRAHLENRPIKAKPPTTSEIISKWTRRNPALMWAAFITLTLVTMTLTASMLFVLREWRISDDRRERATKAEREAKQAHDESTTLANQLARRNYLLHIANTDQALLGKDKDYIRAQAELDICQNDQRGWEWQFLAQRIRHAFPLSFRGSSERLTRDGRRLIAISGSFNSKENHRVVTWNLETGEVQEKLEHDSRLRSICVSNDEQWIGGGDWDGFIIVWDAASGRERWRADTKDHAGSPNRVGSIEFSPDGRFIASAYTDRRLLVVFDPTNGQEKFTLGPFEDAPARVSFSPDGRWLATATGTGMGPALLIDVAAGKVADRFSEKGDMHPIFHPSGRRIATASVDGFIHTWAWDGKKLDKITSWLAVDRRIFNPADRQIYNTAFSSDGTFLASTDRSNQVKVWNATNGELLTRLKSRDAVYGLKFRPSADGQDEQIVMGSATIGIRFWRWRNDEGAKKVKPLDGAVEAKFSPDGKHILASTPMYFTGGSLYYHRHPYYPPESAAILNAESGVKISAIGEAIYAASWSPDGKEIIATPVSGDAIRTYDVETGHPTSRMFPGHTGRFTISRYSPSRDRLVSFSTDHTLRVFEYESGEEIFKRKLSSGDTAVYHGTAADFSHGADFLALGSTIFDTQREARFGLKPASGHWVKRSVFSNDRKRVCFGCSGGLLVQFDIASGKELKRFGGHSGYVRAIAISPDEKYIVAGDTFGQAIVWDVASEQPLVTLTAGDRIVTSLDWSSDGRRIVAGKEDGTVQIWTLPNSP